MMPSTEWAIESGEWKNIIQAYLACVSFVDYEIGRVMKALEKSKHAENTIIVLWSDHGYRLGEKGTFAKHALWEPATKAPLMFAGPSIPQGRIIDEPVELLSIYPTLLALSGLPAYERNEGKSLLNVLKNGKMDPKSVAITTFGMNNHGIKTKESRYIQYEDGGEELYDHNKDPNEWTNLANHPEHKALKEKLQEFLPTVNAPWDPSSNYKFQPYFVEQKARTAGIREEKLKVENAPK
jgi:arylsulfatase A-like enzyme